MSRRKTRVQKDNGNLSQSYVAAGEQPIPRMKLSEMGFMGLKQVNGMILEDSRRELSWPYSVNTYKQMSLDATIAAAIRLVEMMVCRVNWDVKPPINPDDPSQEPTEDQKAKAKFIKQCKDDMEHSWAHFIQEATSAFTYGFSIHEKVYRRRYKKNGSKYNDGLVGIQKLPIRGQDTVYKWLFSDDGRELLGVSQSLNAIFDNYSRYIMLAGSKSPNIEIPRNKFLLFRTGIRKDNPEGISPLKAVYYAWKIRQSIEDVEAVGIARDMRGLPVLELPPRYMSPDASDDEKAVYDYYKNIIRNMQNNEQAGLIIPLLYDPESKQPLFKFSLMGVVGAGTKNYDTDKVIRRYDAKILTTLFADGLTLGQNDVGSFSLASSKSTIMAMAIQQRLNELRDVLNSDLIPQLFALNGWDLADAPTFEYGELEDTDVQELAKAVQQVKAVGMIAPTAGNINYLAEVLGLPDRIPEDMPQEELSALVGPPQTKAGQGYASATGGLNGTANAVSADNNSASNLENK